MNVTLWNSPRRSCSPGIPDSGTTSLGTAEEVLGTDGTVSRSQQIRYTPQKVNRPQGNEMAGQTRTAPRAHMQNFFDCIRTGKEPNCPFELGFRVSIACRMAVESYRAAAAGATGTRRRKRSSTKPAAATPGGWRLSRGLRIHAGTDSTAQVGAGVCRSGNRAARDGVGRRPDLPTGGNPQAGAPGLHGLDFPRGTGRARAWGISSTPS